MMATNAAAYRGASILIELGWPAKQLSPNTGVHFMTRHRFKKAAKDTAYWATKALLPPGKVEHDGSPIAVVITAYPSVARTRDKDNLLASCKAFLDGIALALGVDDNLFDPRVQWGEPVNNAKLVVEVAL